MKEFFTAVAVIAFANALGSAILLIGGALIVLSLVEKLFP
jgi:hypothetical protein